MERDVPTRTVQVLMGHYVGLSSTQRYLHANAEQLAAAVGGWPASCSSAAAPGRGLSYRCLLQIIARLGLAARLPERLTPRQLRQALLDRSASSRQPLFNRKPVAPGAAHVYNADND